MNKRFSIQYQPPVAGRSTAHRFGPDEAAIGADYEPGDFILTHGNACVSRAIRWGQMLWFWGRKSKYAWWNHAALIVSKEGDIIEAVGHGVMRNKLDHYALTEYTVVRVHDDLASSEDRAEVVRYAEWALGQKYGYLTAVSIGLNLLFGGKFSFFIEGQAICSGLVARALERTKVIFDRSPSHIMPADLAFYFDVEPPPTGTSKGKIPT
jgi:uncharacterized protein YycO